jgi:proline iminopeptidase
MSGHPTESSASRDPALDRDGVSRRRVVQALAILGAVVPQRAALSQANEDSEHNCFTRDKVRAIVRDARRIVSPNGVEELRQVTLGGVPQWISVRGRDRRNPILLFIHGGPASTEMPVSWLYQSPWEDFFTVVQWDQRGAGKTAATTKHRDIVPTITIERMTADGEELVAYLRSHYRVAKLFVLAHSWGSVIGLNLARRHPEWLHAYVGMGQMINWIDNERTSYAWVLHQARADNNLKAVAELQALAPYPPADRELTLEEVITQRTWVIYYGGLTAGRRDFAYDLNARKLSPEYTNQDLSPPGFRNGEALVRLLPDLTKLDLGDVMQTDCPVVLFAGRRDYQTPSEVSVRWLERLKAPYKNLFWFEQSAHMMQLEEPGRVLMHLVNDIRPLATATNEGP